MFWWNVRSAGRVKPDPTAEFCGEFRSYGEPRSDGDCESAANRERGSYAKPNLESIAANEPVAPTVECTGVGTSSIACTSTTPTGHVNTAMSLICAGS